MSDYYKLDPRLGRTPASYAGNAMIHRLDMPLGEAWQSGMDNYNKALGHQDRNARTEIAADSQNLTKQKWQTQQGLLAVEKDTRAQEDEEIDKWVQTNRPDMMMAPPSMKREAFKRAMLPTSGKLKDRYMTVNKRVYDLQDQKFMTGSTEPTGPDVEGESKLRKEYASVTKAFIKDQTSYDNILVSYQDASDLPKGEKADPTKDWAMVINMAKMLDPTSVVREGEFKVIAENASFGDSLKQRWEQLVSGARLTQTQRNQMMDMAKSVYNKKRETQQKNQKYYSNLANSYGFAPERISRRLTNPKWQKGAPKQTSKRNTRIPTSGSVMMTDANGRILSIPKEMEQEALSSGMTHAK